MKSLVLVALLGGCACEPDHLIGDAAAPAKPYASEINACITRHDCDSLCEQLFVLQAGQTMTDCRIEHVDAQGTADVRVFYDDTNVCAAQGGGDVYVGGDDGTDDGSTDTGDDGGGDGSDTGDDGGGDGTDTGDDGSTDDGSTDGSTDDGSTDDGSTDDGGGDDGSTGDYRHAPRSLPRALISPARR